mmetsp:Transcript_1432/g.5635  ORF Transcript_1432/g.5635 Transcript_1432/m.5635 type:complete len:224 (-) Transcript_1432:69-740(-)
MFRRSLRSRQPRLPPNPSSARTNMGCGSGTRSARRGCWLFPAWGTRLTLETALLPLAGAGVRMRLCMNHQPLPRRVLATARALRPLTLTSRNSQCRPLLNSVGSSRLTRPPLPRPVRGDPAQRRGAPWLASRLPEASEPLLPMRYKTGLMPETAMWWTPPSQLPRRQPRRQLPSQRPARRQRSAAVSWGGCSAGLVGRRSEKVRRFAERLKPVCGLSVRMCDW